jgi:anthranilate synthase component 2
VFGGKLLNLSTIYHGVATPIKVISEKSKVKSYLFDGVPEILEVGRYHSWIVADENFPEELEVTARDDNGYIMALQHKNYDVQGVQFHPESVLTPKGEEILRNWLKN